MNVPAPGPHGGDGRSVARALGLDPDSILDLSVSCNPFAPDPTAIVARHLARGALRRYPDAEDVRVAEEAMADALGVDPGRVMVTSGGAEAIALVAGLLERGWVEEPDFSLYRRHLPVVERGALHFRSDPHNPTGLLAADGIDAAVWDEAFYPLATGRWTKKRSTPAVVVGSLTKVFGCPGLRLGYVVVPEDDGVAIGVPGMRARLAERQPRWSVATPALAALPELLAGADLEGWARAIATHRTALSELLARHGLRPLPSDANFVLVEHAGGLREHLARHGVVVRDAASFGLAGCARVAVPDAGGLERLAVALENDAAAVSGRRTDVPHVRGLDQVGQRVEPRGVEPEPKDGALRGALMVCGTASDVGKSQVVAGLCRVLARRGVRVAPFKGQNMSLNSAVTAGGGEIGRAQALQAAAAGIEPEPAMNPVLLKPGSDRVSQVVVMGRPWRTLNASRYQEAKAELEPVVLEALSGLRQRYDVVVCEGAGSPAEINLMDHDLVNLGLAARAGLPAVIVGDIDRGGVFAHLFGTVLLLPEGLRERVRGFVLNKLRGDPALLGDAPRELEERTGVPTLGVLPWLEGVWMDAEDSMALAAAPRVGDAQAGASSGSRPTCAIDVAVVAFPRFSNFTDVDPLLVEPDVCVRFVRASAELGDPDLIVLPGTKATIADLRWLRDTGLAAQVPGAAARGTTVLGICGGFQMMGRTIRDPFAVESAVHQTDGLGWLEAETRFFREKHTQLRRGRELASGVPVSGYEIHHGRVERAPQTDAWLTLDGPVENGTASEGVAQAEAGLYGTSLHGIFESDAFRAEFLGRLAARRAKRRQRSGVSFAAVREAHLDRLADACEAHLDLAVLDRVVSEAAPFDPAPSDASSTLTPVTRSVS